MYEWNRACQSWLLVTACDRARKRQLSSPIMLHMLRFVCLPVCLWTVSCNERYTHVCDFVACARTLFSISNNVNCMRRRAAIWNSASMKAIWQSLKMLCCSEPVVCVLSVTRFCEQHDVSSQRLVSFISLSACLALVQLFFSSVVS